MSVQILQGDVRDMLATLPDESVHCVVTSPPYWGLRDYGVDGQIGMEPTMGEHIDTMVDVFREVRRVLRKDGTCWLNYGDCYATAPNGRSAADTKATGNDDRTFRDKPFSTVGGTLKPKDLCMIPNRLAIALQEPYHLGPIKNEIDRAWLAGLIDADGCIGIRRQDNGEWNPTYIPYLTVGCSDRLLVERCSEITGLGKVNIKSRAGETDNRGINQRRDGYVWRLDGQVASRVIRDIYPYLVQKWPQAKVCNAMNVTQGEARTARNKPVAPDIVAYRARLYDLNKSLNQREDVILPALPEVKSNVEQGWWVRSEIIWAKPNPMPESVTDRPATAHEKIWLLTKSARYFYDAEAVRTASGWNPTKTKMPDGWDTGPGAHGTVHRSGREKGRKTDKQRGVPKRQYAGFNDRWDAKEANGEILSGANLRNVWTIPTKGFSGAHYATFPPDLIVPCIKAGTSEKGCCAECGAAWVRETETKIDESRPLARQNINEPEVTKAGQSTNAKGSKTWGHYLTHTTTDWSASCRCNAATIPCAVLDPFIGSGTTAMVADRLGRDCIGIDLNSANIEMSKDRIVADAGMFAEVT